MASIPFPSELVPERRPSESKPSDKPKDNTPSPEEEELKKIHEDLEGLKTTPEEEELTKLKLEETKKEKSIFNKVKNFFNYEDKKTKVKEFIQTKIMDNLKKGVFFNISKGILKLGAYITGGGFLDGLMNLLALAFIDPNGSFLTMLINLFSMLMVWLINTLATLIPRLITIIANAVPVIISSIQKIFEAIMNLIPVIIVTLIKLIPLLVESFEKIADALIRGVITAIPILLDAIISLFPIVIKSLIDIIRINIFGKKQLFGEFFKNFFAKMKDLGKVLMDAFKMIGEFIWKEVLGGGELLSKIGNFLYEALLSGMNLFGEFMDKDFLNLLQKGLSTYLDYMNVIWTNLPSYIEKFADFLGDAIEKFVPKLGLMIEKAIPMIVEFIKKAVKLIVPMIIKIVPILFKLWWKWVSTIIPIIIKLLWTVVKEIPGLVWDLIVAVAPLIWSLIKMAGSVIWTTIKAVGGVVWEVIKGMFSLLWTLIKAAIQVYLKLVETLIKTFIIRPLFKLFEFLKVKKILNEVISKVVEWADKIKMAIKNLLESPFFKWIKDVVSRFSGGVSGAVQTAQNVGRQVLQFLKPEWLDEFLKMKWLEKMYDVFKVLGKYLSNIGKVVTGRYSWEDAQREIEAAPRAVGDWNVANDMIVKLHKGEMVVPEDTSRLIREGRQDFTKFHEGSKSLSSSGFNSSVSVESSDTSKLESLLKELIEVSKNKELKVKVPEGSAPSGGLGTLSLGRF